MQYKVSPTNALWSLKDGPTIQLWKEDGIGRPKLSMGVSNPVPFHPVWGNDELRACEKEMLINRGISKYENLVEIRPIWWPPDGFCSPT
jgi:hypothetical protein